ncbi:PREDICTED: serine--pyruvate aminotransferase-like [Priapulus caudatus]|uniref:Alanine--glyoxylate aminotransferase n=1 Tax=Priapulus caudatus TaxID=37621 RepID=A0ABM1F414_PRICU|nr:PREDICTED: serine--pyruvate aminotransferase-like [Priapulus caudatus]
MAQYLRSVVRPAERLLKPLQFPHKLLMGPGPSNCPPRVLAAQALPLLGHLHAEFCSVMDDVKAGARYAFQTANAVTLAVSGTGHAAMEAAICNIVEPGDVVLIAKNGHWGARAADMAARHGADVRTIVVPPGEVFTLANIAAAMAEHAPSLTFVCHGESSAGTMQPLEGVGELCRARDCLLLVDTVASLGGAPFFADALGIDVVYTGAQKVIGAPPGVSPISFSERAMARVAARATRVRSYYFDVVELANYWGCDAGPRRYHHTAPISSMYALREGLSMLAEETLEVCWERHLRCARLLWRGIEDLGLKLLVENEDARLPTVTAVVVPDGVAWKRVVEHCMSKHAVEISGGLGPTAGKVWRIGLMGYNATEENVRRVLKVLQEAITACKM